MSTRATRSLSLALIASGAIALGTVAFAGLKGTIGFADDATVVAEGLKGTIGFADDAIVVADGLKGTIGFSDPGGELAIRGTIG